MSSLCRSISMAYYGMQHARIHSFIYSLIHSFISQIFTEHLAAPYRCRGQGNKTEQNFSFHSSYIHYQQSQPDLIEAEMPGTHFPRLFLSLITEIL